MSTSKIPEMFTRALKRKNGLPVEVVKASGSSPDKKCQTKEKKKTDTNNEMPDSLQRCVAMDEINIETLPSHISSTPGTVPTTSNDENSEVFKLSDLFADVSWKTALAAEFEKKYWTNIEQFLIKQYEKKVQVFPPKQEIFTAFNLSSLQDVRVVVIGQDPYHDDNQAHGLSFSVKKGVRPPPSLKNIYKELALDHEGFETPSHGFLEGWAKQGVFLLNATLTVEAHKANSHAQIGWQQFTDTVIKVISREREGVVFLLWGGFAHKKEAIIDAKKHKVIKTAHPSPLSARHWWGCRCFSKTNEALKDFGKDPIDWNKL